MLGRRRPRKSLFKSHTGRWDPLPDEGDRDEMIALVVDELGPYLDPANY
jgi:hypothetical protein